MNTNQNWQIWKESMKHLIHYHKVGDYIHGTVAHPNNPAGAEIWDDNNSYTQVILMMSLSLLQMIHVSQCQTPSAMWNSLEVMHKTKGHQTIIALICNLFPTIVEEGTNIHGHLNKLKSLWECITQIGNKDFHILDTLFIVIISSSLPPSWDNFTEPYVSSGCSLVGKDLKKLMGSQEFIGLLKEEYMH